MFKWNQKVKKTLIYSSAVLSVGLSYEMIRKHGNETVWLGATGQLTLLTTESTFLYALDSVNMRSKIVEGSNKSMLKVI